MVRQLAWTLSASRKPNGVMFGITVADLFSCAYKRLIEQLNGHVSKHNLISNPEPDLKVRHGAAMGHRIC